MIASPRGCVEPLAPSALAAHVKECARLPALSTTSNTLRELLRDDGGYIHQISDVIRRDPSLTARVLRVVNSVYYGLPQRVNNIEQAVFFLGIRQVRQLATVTPIIEEFQILTSRAQFPWRLFWQHCLGTALLTNDLLNLLATQEDELGYLAGLLHDVGKIVIAATLPDHFAAIRERMDVEGADLLTIEQEIIGATHAEVGALFLEAQSVPEAIVAAARWHHQPDAAPSNTVAAVQVADYLVRHARIGHSGNQSAITRESFIQASGWTILFKGIAPEQRALARASIERSVSRLPMVLDGLI